MVIITIQILLHEIDQSFLQLFSNIHEMETIIIGKWGIGQFLNLKSITFSDKM